jgi:hypothetical protein
MTIPDTTDDTQPTQELQQENDDEIMSDETDQSPTNESYPPQVNPQSQKTEQSKQIHTDTGLFKKKF